MKWERDVYKIIPVSLSDIPGLEGWLEEQANLGLFPLRLSSYAHFCHKGVPGTRFRLEPSGREKYPSQEQLELYGQAGWHYATRVGKIFFLYYAEDSGAPELYTDWSSRGISLDRLAKKVKAAYRRKLLGLVLLTLLLFLEILLFSVLPAGKYDVQPNPGARLALLPLVLANPIMLFCILSLATLYREGRRECRLLLAAHRNLSEGLPPPPSPGPSRWVWGRNAVLLFSIPILCVIWSCTFFKIGETVPLERFRRPYVPLEQIEQVPTARWDKLFGEETAWIHEDENLVERDWSLLAPVWYTVSEEVYELDSEIDNSFSPEREPDCRYAPRMEMTRLHLLIPAMARPVAEAALDKLRLVNLYWEYEETTYPDLDFVILARDSSGVHQMAALARGGRVAVFRYGGAEDLAGHLETLSAMVR